MKKPEYAWVKEFPGAVTVCDVNGIIIEMNDEAEKTFEGDGGRDLIGKNVLACHPEPAHTELAGLMKARKRNIYTIKKNGVKKLIYQSPWYFNGEYAGFLELSLEVPMEMPHFVRD